MNTWQLQKAKAQLSEVVRQAVDDGPQLITVRGEPEVVVLSKEAYDKIVHPKPSFVELIRQSPLVGLDLDLERDKSGPRDDIEW